MFQIKMGECAYDLSLPEYVTISLKFPLVIWEGKCLYRTFLFPSKWAFTSSFAAIFVWEGMFLAGYISQVNRNVQSYLMFSS